MSVQSSLIELLRANIGRPLTADLAADICMMVHGRRPRALPAPAEFGEAQYTGSEEIGPIVFRVERVVDVLPEILKLWRDHWSETEGYREGVGFNPDAEQYIAIDRAGGFLLVTARVGLELVGYFMVVLHTSRHSSQFVGGEDAFYLVPRCRRGFALVKMLDFTLECLRLCGARQLTLSEKLTNLIGPVLKRAGMTHCGNLWTIVLEGDGHVL